MDLVSENFERLDDRWNKPLAQQGSLVEANYIGLQALVKRCEDQRIRFLLVQPPIREDIMTAEDAAFLKEAHWPRLAKICHERRGAFHNFHRTLTMTEDDFADSSHLSRSGARKLSTAMATLLKK